MHMQLWHCLAVNEEVSFTNKPVHSIPFYLSQQRHINSKWKLVKYSLGKMVIICNRCFHSGFHMLAFIIKMYGTTSAGSLIQSQSGKQKVCRVVRANVQRCHLLLWSTHYQLELLLSGCEERFTEQVTAAKPVGCEGRNEGGRRTVCAVP